MKEESKYYVLKEQAVPEVLLKVVEAKKLLDCEKASSVSEAVSLVGISRSSFYKYKDDIFSFHNNARGRTITMMIQYEDELGVLSRITNVISGSYANILTAHQSIPINGVASLSLSVEVLEDTTDLSDMIDQLEELQHIQYVKILARE